MQEAFRRALQDLEAKHQRPHQALRGLRLLQDGTAPGPQEARLLPSEQLRKLCYTAQKLGRRWGTYTNLGGGQASEKDYLEDEWTLLMRQFSTIGEDQRAQLLFAVLLGMNFGRPAADERKRRYLEQGSTASRAVRRPEPDSPSGRALAGGLPRACDRGAHQLPERRASKAPHCHR